ncbi:hypothetical protein [Campylobacter sp. CNRCH_2015_0814]|uniref:hypothetical protein n=1 Tax=Campylobacter sp. CNRCH_2015_0814 TaxID=2911606 RepID=UPI0021E64608|nr:hypothetical protein [Campylobacter sp. CNRCH_2015_0814]MCV3470298.1 hypothetical protein [Campylobacter sp. CNRCH_2015_0814]
MNIIEFHFLNENKIQAQIENSNEKFLGYFWKKVKSTINILKPCKYLVNLIF